MVHRKSMNLARFQSPDLIASPIGICAIRTSLSGGATLDPLGIRQPHNSSHLKELLTSQAISVEEYCTSNITLTNHVEQLQRVSGFQFFSEFLLTS